MASVRTIKDAIQITRDAGITPFIWGHRGIGKSSLVHQLAVEQGMGFIDLRCSQLEASDLRGLPDRVDGRTHYLPPADMPIGDMTPAQVERELALVLYSESELADLTAKKGGKNIPDLIALKLENADIETVRKYELKRRSLQPRFQRGILFLDELNRSQDDVLQAGFQLILDRSVGQYVLPPGWSIVAAGNFSEGYQVSGFNDPAFLNRFCHMTLSNGETTLEEWIMYMSSVHASDASSVIEFASQNTKHLDGDIPGELGFSIQPSRRSWEMVVKVEKAVRSGSYSEIATTEVLAGLIGRELATTYRRYSCPVKPRDLLAQGVHAMEGKLKKLGRSEQVGLMWGLVSFCKNKMDDDPTMNVCLDFASWLTKNSSDKDIVVAFCRSLVASGDPNDSLEKARAAVISNPKLANMIAQYKKHQTGGAGKKDFITRLTERPELQAALSKVTWGSTGSDKDD